jgi:hypothetical protein
MLRYRTLWYGHTASPDNAAQDTSALFNTVVRDTVVQNTAVMDTMVQNTAPLDPISNNTTEEDTAFPL